MSPREREVRAALAEGVEGVRSRPGGGLEEWHHPETGKLHRLGGPAAIGRTSSYYVAGHKHRVDGPAEVNDAYEKWWLFGEVHRVDGPAIEYAVGRRVWVVSGCDVTSVQEEWEELSRLYDDGLRDQLEQVLTLWRPGGPNVLELSAGVQAAYA